MAIHDLINSTNPYLYSAGIGTAVGAGVYSLASVVRGMRRGTTVPRQLHNGSNVVLGLGAGMAAGLATLDPTVPTQTSAMTVVGAAALGAGASALIRPVYHAATTTDGLLDNLPAQARQGAMRGAIAAPIAYGVLCSLSHYLP